MRDPETDFDRFWQAYPKRQKKADARKAWTQLKPDAALVQRMLDALQWQTQQPAWLKEGGQFVPLPASWLRGERWEDEPFQVPNLSGRSVRLLQTLRTPTRRLY